MTDRVVLADQTVFDTEREFYCNNCKDFRDVFTGPPGDIVCWECHYVIASFKDRQVIRAALAASLREIDEVRAENASLNTEHFNLTRLYGEMNDEAQVLRARVEELETALWFEHYRDVFPNARTDHGDCAACRLLAALVAAGEEP